MKRLFWVLPALPFLLAGCGNSVKQTLGMERTVPDEFAVVERAPLVMPPDFNLEPPRPGAPRPQEAARTEALVMGGAVATSASASAGENALLSKIGTRADPNIRQELRVNTDQGEAATVTEKLGFATPESGKALNPTEEAEKLKQQKINTSGSVSVPQATQKTDKK